MGLCKIPVNVYTNSHSLWLEPGADGDLFRYYNWRAAFCGSTARKGGHRFLIQLPGAIAVAIDHLHITKQLITQKV